MVEYALVLSSLREAWSEQMFPLIDAIRSSPFLWPGIVAVTITFLLLTRPRR